MKKIIINLCVLFVFIMTISCYDGEDERVVGREDFIGHWSLSDSEADRLIDYDYDGTYAMSIQEDYICVDSELILFEDGSFTENWSDRYFINNEVHCVSFDPVMGNWSFNSSTGKVIFEYDNSAEIVEFSYFFTNSTFITTTKVFSDVDGDFNAVLEYVLMR